MVEVIHGAALGGLLGDTQTLEEFAGVAVAIIEVDVLGVNVDLGTDHEVIHREELFASVTEHFLTL